MPPVAPLVTGCSIRTRTPADTFLTAGKSLSARTPAGVLLIADGPINDDLAT
ncbi:hypothetical protein ACFLIM_04115 [Nonomuraea sp. M3C6]|uniref:Uncharacterized protein n=1 Tax=Nonomuraea marmarensis TaxID=3351344 RepID=A0ABW7A5T1_9ACTN